jgi:hypothetical protein
VPSKNKHVNNPKMPRYPRKSSSSKSRDRRPPYEGSSSSSNATENSPASEGSALTRPKPNNKLDPKETLSKAIEEYNQDRGPEDEEISLDDCCRKFDSSEAGPDHEKEQKEWQEFVNKVNREIERLTELKRKYRRGIFGGTCSTISFFIHFR